jgi:hypothetical protein
VDGLIIKKKWLDKILSGKKKMEIRGHIPWGHKDLYIALIESGSGEIKGTCLLHSVTALWERDWFRKMKKYHCVPLKDKKLIKYKRCYAWWFSEAFRYKKPIPYKHPQGAVIWVKNVL